MDLNCRRPRENASTAEIPDTGDDVDATDMMSVIDAKFFSEGVDTHKIVCPTCSSESTSRYGTTKKGTQRYKCKECGKVFVNNDPSAPYTRLDRDTWVNFTQCTAKEMTLRASALKCGVSVKTLCYMRTRLRRLMQ